MCDAAAAEGLTVQERLQKVLAQAGLASRREAELWILGGRVSINGVVITALGTKADPLKDKISVDGKPIEISEKKAYYLFHKPMHVMVTRHDPQGRSTVYDYLKDISERINPVGRLDFDSEGLLLLTNDGDLHAKLTHPKHEVSKTYQVKIAGFLPEEQQERMRQGVNIGDVVTQPCQVKEIKRNPHNSWLEITIHEGKNRQVRRMIDFFGHGVLRLIRVGIGPLQLGDLPKGEWRFLEKTEVDVLKKL